MGLRVLRNYKLLDFISMQALGIKPSILSTFKKWLLRIIVYEVKFRWNILVEEKIKRIKRLIEELNINSNSIEKIREYNYQHEVSEVDKVTRLSILFSQPKWIVKYLLELLKNPIECEELLKN